MKWKEYILLGLVLVLSMLFVAACVEAEVMDPEQDNPDPGVTTAEGDLEQPEWASTEYFTPPQDAASGLPFAARLALATTQMTVDADPADNFVQYPWEWWGVFDFLAATDPEGAVPLFELDTTLFPGLPLEIVVSETGDVIPTERGLTRNPVLSRTVSFWDMIAGPGRAWDIGDGWSRASFPISLVQSYEGQAWLGLASFDYNGDEVTPLKVLFSSVSAGGFIFWDSDFDVNAWAEVPVTLGAIRADPTAITTAFAAERSDRIPVEPLSDLGEDFATAAAALDADDTLALAVLMDGILYMNPVDTPFGPHPYPLDMRVGVWSVTKSLIPGIAAMRLAQKFGPDFLDSPIVGYFLEGEEFDYISETARVRWQDVTILHTLNMMTGMGATDADKNWASENLNTYQWSYSYDLDDQIRYYFNVEPNPDVIGPGQSMAYIDQDMWIAVLAMQRYLQSQEGPEATILSMLETEVYDAIGAEHFACGTNYTADGSPGVPLSGWGALPTVEILARAGKLIGNGGRAPDGMQLLHPDLVTGLTTSTDYGLTFWRDASAEVTIPNMRGAGGNRVFSLPNGIVIVVLGRDNYNVEISDEAEAALIAAALDLKSF